MGLNNYEIVKERKTRLKSDYPDAKIMPFILSDMYHSPNYVVVGALIWKDGKTLDNISPDVWQSFAKLSQSANSSNAGVILTALALMTKADSSGYSFSMAGGKGADKNAWVENAEESAVGRALDNMGYHSNSPSREEMEKVSYIEDARMNRQALEGQVQNLNNQLLSAGYPQSSITQSLNENVRTFTFLTELSAAELIKVRDILLSTMNNLTNAQN